MTESEYPLVLKAAWYYYMEGYTQQEVSKTLGTSRARVVRLLEVAREQGVIQFAFRRGDSRRMRMELELAERFGLKDAQVVPTPRIASALNNSLAEAAALYVADHLRPDGFLNIGYGDTMGLVLDHLARSGSSQVNVVSLTGGVSHYLPTVASGVFGMRLYLIPTPLIVSTPQLRDALLDEPSVQDVYRMADYADMSLVGIGGMSEGATVLRDGILSKNELALLKVQGSVGDMLNHFLDATGEPMASSIEGRSISTGLDRLQAMDNVVGVAGGPAKLEAMRAVLRHGYLNVLITDVATAEGLLEDPKGG